MVFSSKFSAFVKKATHAACDSNNCMRAFPSDNHHMSVNSKSDLYLKSHALKGWNEIKLIIFTALLRTLLSKTDIFTACVAVRKVRTN